MKNYFEYFMSKFKKKTDREADSSVSGRYISRERDTPTSEESEVLKLFQFKAGENFGSIFELTLSPNPLDSIKKELDYKISELKKEMIKDNQNKGLIEAAIKNIENLDIYEIKAENSKIYKEYICNFKQLGA